jgi:hypothetical protein
LRFGEVAEDCAPYASFTSHALTAFVIGQSEIVGGVTTDVVAITDGRMQWQLWIGTDDKLPRLIWSTPADMPPKPRVMVAFSNWRTGGAVDAGSFKTRARRRRCNRIRRISGRRDWCRHLEYDI